MSELHEERTINKRRNLLKVDYAIKIIIAGWTDDSIRKLIFNYITGKDED